MKRAQIIAAALVVAAAGSIIFKNAISPDKPEPAVTTRAGITVSGDEWEQFKKDAAAGKKCAVKLELSSLKDEVPGELRFDGEYYIYTKNDAVYKRKHLIDAAGHQPGAEIGSRWIVLADEEYTYDELEKSITSSDSRDSLNYDVLMWS